MSNQIKLGNGQTVDIIDNLDYVTIKQLSNGALYVDGSQLTNIPETGVVNLVSDLASKQNLVANPNANNIIIQNAQGQGVDSGKYIASNFTNPDNTNLPTTGAVKTQIDAGNAQTLSSANTFATNAANNAEATAISVASADATTKVNAGVAQANEYTDQSCATILDSANSYTDTECATVQANASTDATNKSNVAEQNAKDYTDSELELYQQLIVSPQADNFVTSDANGQTFATSIPISLLENFNGNNQILKAVANQLPTSIEGIASQIYIRTSFAPSNSAIAINDSVSVGLEKSQGQINQLNTNLTNFESSTNASLSTKANKIIAPTEYALVIQNAGGDIVNSGVTISVDSTFVGASNTTVSTSLATKTYLQTNLANKQDLKIPAVANSIALLDSFGQVQSSSKIISSDISMSGGSTSLNDTGSTKTYIDNQDATKLNLISGGATDQIISQGLSGQVKSSGKVFVTSIVHGSSSDSQIPTSLAVDNFVTGIQNLLQASIDTKASTVYVDAQDSDLQNQINTKAATSYVDAQIASVNTAIDLKANISYVDAQDAILQGNINQKADISYVDATFIPLSQKGQNNGVATLDGSGKLTISQLPVGALIYKGTWNASTNTPALADGTGTAGDYYIVSVAGTQTFGGQPVSFLVDDSVIYNGSIWEKVGNANEVISVNGQQGIVVLTKSDLGLGNVQDIDTTNATNINIANPFTANNAVIAQGQTVQEGLQNAQGQINARIVKVASAVLNNLPILLADGTLQDSGESVSSILSLANTSATSYTNARIATVQPLAIDAVNGNIAIFNDQTTVDSLKSFTTTINGSSTNNQIPTALAVQSKINSLTINDINGFDVTAPAIKQTLFYNAVNGIFENRVIATSDLPTGIDAVNIADGSISNAEFQYLNGVSSSIQTQINSKASLITPAEGKLLSSDAQGAYQSTSVSISTDSGLEGGNGTVSTSGATKSYIDTGLALKIAKITGATTGNLLSVASSGAGIQDTGIASSSLVTKSAGQIDSIGGSNLTGLSKTQVGLGNVQDIDTTNASNVVLVSFLIGANQSIAQNDNSAVAFGKTQAQINANVQSIANANTSIVTLQGQMGTANTNIATLQTEMSTANTNITSLQNGKLDKALANGKLFIGNVSGVATGQDISGVITISNSGVTSFVGNIVINQLLAGYISASGTITQADSILTAIQKLNGNIRLVSLDLDTLQGGLFAANSNIATLQGQMSDANANISTLQTGLSTANSNITALQVEMSTANTNISALQSGLSTANSNIANLEANKISTALADGNIIVGNESGIASSVVMDGDVSISNTGFTSVSNSAVINKVLTGLDLSTNFPIVATDSIIISFGKIQAQINATIADLYTLDNAKLTKPFLTNGYIPTTTDDGNSLTDSPAGFDQNNVLVSNSKPNNIVVNLTNVTISNTSAQRYVLTGGVVSVSMPNATTLGVGQYWIIVNNSGATVSLYKNDASTIITSILDGQEAVVTCFENNSTNGIWQYSLSTFTII
jgi:peptidoglycan hydrolase CwlO-like protein